MGQFPGTDGYQLQAPLLIPEYDKADFRDVHGDLLQMLDTSKRSLLDIWAGSGRDAFGFASLGYDVTAVEPTDAMYEGAMSKEGSDQIRSNGSKMGCPSWRNSPSVPLILSC